MDFGFTETQLEVQRQARVYSDDVLFPSAGTWETQEEIPEEVFQGLGQRGLMAVNSSREFGGAASGVISYSLAMMETARGCAATAVTMAVTNMVGEVVGEFGTPEQKELVIPALAKGALGGFALSEVEAGSDPGGMRTTATQDGDEWVIRGTKQWISHGDTSRFLVLWARTGGEGARGISCFLVDGDAEGLSVTNHEDKMGLRASHTVGLLLEDVRVPGSRLLGGLGGGFPIAMMALDGGRIGIASQAIGIATRAVSLAREHLRKKQGVGSEQGLLWKLADSVTELEAARLLTLRAASMKESGAVFSKEASMAKVYATEATWRIVNRVVELTADADSAVRRSAERCLRDARVTRIYEGTSEVQRIVISRAALLG